MESEPHISVLIATRNRPATVTKCIQSIIDQNYNNYDILILDNSRDVNTCGRISEISTDDRIECEHINKRLGVAGSRNRLMEQASGDIFVTIDDDARFKNKNSLSKIVDGFEPNVGIQSFKIINHINSNSKEPNEILAPLPQSKKSNQDLSQDFYSSYFHGGGHAIKREVIDECGIYEPRLIYGMEELDLSYRTINQGWKIKYNSSVIIHHYPEQSEIDQDTRDHSELYYNVANRIYFAGRYLPIRYACSYVTIWLGYIFIQAMNDQLFSDYISGVKRGIHLLRTTEREPLNDESVSYISENYGRLWY